MLTAFLAAAAFTLSPVDRALMAGWHAQNEICRGDPRPTPMCRERTNTQRILAKRGWQRGEGYWFREMRK